jgi:hypothetical protein
MFQDDVVKIHFFNTNGGRIVFWTTQISFPENINDDNFGSM